MGASLIDAGGLGVDVKGPNISLQEFTFGCNITSFLVLLSKDLFDVDFVGPLN